MILSIYFLLELVYYPLAVYFSHYCYKNFKHESQGDPQMFPPMNRAGFNAPQDPQGGNYRRIDEGRQR